MDQQKLIEKIVEELKDLPYLIAKQAAGDRQSDVKMGKDQAMEFVAVQINTLLETATKNEWGTNYINALHDVQKKLGFKGTTMELLVDRKTE